MNPTREKGESGLCKNEYRDLSPVFSERVSSEEPRVSSPPLSSTAEDRGTKQYREWGLD